MTFADLKFQPDTRFVGTYAKADFPNGYGASVIRFSQKFHGVQIESRGGSAGLYELAVTHRGRLCYDTPITDDVLGYLTEDDVTRVLGEIEALPKTRFKKIK